MRTPKDTKSTTSMDRRRRMVNAFGDAEYRRGSVSERVSSGVALQIRANRDSRHLTQAELGALADMKQNTISRLEDPDSESSPTLRTLDRLAAAFDCGLIVAFVSFADYIDWASTRAATPLNVPSWGEDKGLARHHRQDSDHDRLLKPVVVRAQTQPIRNQKMPSNVVSIPSLLAKTEVLSQLDASTREGLSNAC